MKEESLESLGSLLNQAPIQAWVTCLSQRRPRRAGPMEAKPRLAGLQWAPKILNPAVDSFDSSQERQTFRRSNWQLQFRGITTEDDTR